MAHAQSRHRSSRRHYGPAKVIELHVIKEQVTVLYDEGDEFRRGELLGPA